MLSFSDWLAVATIAAPLCAKALTDWSTNKKLAHNMALQKIVGMAGREAATIARTLNSLPPTANPQQVERSLIRTSASAMMEEMKDSAAVTGADEDKLQRIVQGEVNKIVVPAKTTVVVTAPQAPSSAIASTS